MTTIASQITSLTSVYSTVYSDADQRKHQSSASLAFVWGIRRDRWIPRTKGQLRGKCFHLMTSSWAGTWWCVRSSNNTKEVVIKYYMTSESLWWVFSYISGRWHQTVEICTQRRLNVVTDLKTNIWTWLSLLEICWPTLPTSQWHTCIEWSNVAPPDNFPD